MLNEKKIKYKKQKWLLKVANFIKIFINISGPKNDADYHQSQENLSKSAL